MTRILIVDDNPAVRRYLRAILEQQEAWKVCGEARTGAEALHRFWRQLRTSSCSIIKCPI